MIFGCTFTYPLLVVALLTSLYFWNKYGALDYSKLKVSGPFRVGYREFTTTEYETPCSVFYPAANDGSGKKGVPLFLYGK